MNLKKYLFLPVWLIFLLSILSAAALVTVFVKGMEESIIAYAIYVISFYALTVAGLKLWFYIPKKYVQIKEKVLQNPFGARYFSNKFFKMRVNLKFTFIVNVLYSALNLFYGLYLKTAWFILFAAYYFIMAVMRFILLWYFRKKEPVKSRKKELYRVAICAVILITVNFVLTGAVLMMYYFDRGFNYSGILIYVMALYTFYITTIATVNIFRYRKFKSPVMSMAKNISLASALMSMLSLETAMLSQFGAETSYITKKILILCTGGGISIIITGLAVYTLKKSLNELKGEKNE